MRKTGHLVRAAAIFLLMLLFTSCGGKTPLTGKDAQAAVDFVEKNMQALTGYSMLFELQTEELGSESVKMKVLFDLREERPNFCMITGFTTGQGEEISSEMTYADGVFYTKGKVGDVEILQKMSGEPEDFLGSYVNPFDSGVRPSYARVSFVGKEEGLTLLMGAFREEDAEAFVRDVIDGWDEYDRADVLSQISVIDTIYANREGYAVKTIRVLSFRLHEKSYTLRLVNEFDDFNEIDPITPPADADRYTERE